MPICYNIYSAVRYILFYIHIVYTLYYIWYTAYYVTYCILYIVLYTGHHIHHIVLYYYAHTLLYTVPTVLHALYTLLHIVFYTLYSVLYTHYEIYKLLYTEHYIHFTICRIFTFKSLQCQMTSHIWFLRTSGYVKTALISVIKYKTLLSAKYLLFNMNWVKVRKNKWKWNY